MSDRGCRGPRVPAFLERPGHVEQLRGVVRRVYAAAENVLRVKVNREVTRIRKVPGVPALDGTIRVYRAKVKEVFKGCLRRGRTIKLYTATE